MCDEFGCAVSIERIGYVGCHAGVTRLALEREVGGGIQVGYCSDDLGRSSVGSTAVGSIVVSVGGIPSK